jgi:hypothetical protein
MRISHRLETLVIMGGLTLGVAATSPQSAQAASPCVENFSEKGDWSAGMAFKTFVDVKGTTADKVYVTIGREMAKEGYLGIAVSKDLGLVSGYQEFSHGKKATLNVTVTETDPGTLRIEAVFTLARGLRASAGAMRDEMCKGLDALLSPGERTDTASTPRSP